MRRSPTSRVVDVAGRLDAQQWWLRSLIPVGAAVFLGLIRAAGGDFHPVFSLLILLLAIVAILTPDSPVTLLVLSGLIGLWFASVQDARSPWVLAALPVLVVVHVAATLASYGPPGMVVAGSLIRLWAHRGLLLAAAGWVVWVGARAVSVLEPTPSGWLFGLALVLVLGWVGFLLSRLGAGATMRE